MKTKNFLLGWLASFVVCFVLGYAWHEGIMSDFYTENFDRLPNPGINVGITAFAYLILTFLMTLIYALWNRGGNPVKEGLLLGLIVGILWSLPSPLMDMAFGVGITPSGILFDSGWQMIEEGIGGIVLAWSYQYLSLRSKTKEIIFNPPL
jgi:predicted permease